MNEIIFAEGHPLAMKEEKFALNSAFACSVSQSSEQFTFLSHLKSWELDLVFPFQGSSECSR